MNAFSLANPNDRRHALLAALLVLIGSVRIVSTYSVFSHTIDEPSHLAAGMEYLSTGKFFYDNESPPLAVVFGALGPFLAGERFHPGPDSLYEGYRILGRNAHYDRILTLGRLGILPFFWIASLVVFLWGYRAGGPIAADIATLLFTTLPTVLAHAGLITTDMALTAFMGAAAYASLLWAEQPSRRRTLILGLAVGLAVVSKFTALAFLPAAWLAMYGWHLLRTRPGFRVAVQTVWERRRAAAVVLGVASLVIWAAYRFSFARVDFLHCRLPAPRFFNGLLILWKDAQGHPAYLLGRRSPTGFWYYFPVVLGLKTPLAMLLLALVSPWVAGRVARYWPAMPLAFAIGILLFAMTSHTDMGVRHVLPVYVGLAVACGTAVAAVFRNRSLSRWQKATATAAALMLLGWHVGSGAWQAPDYLAYTNEIAGDHPEDFVADSNLDWGQDMRRFGEHFLRAGVTEVSFQPFDELCGVLAGPPLPRMTPSAHDYPSPGWNAISISRWKIFGDPTWVDGLQPQVRIGRGIWAWYVPQSK